MDQGTKKIVKMLTLPFFIFLTLPIAFGIKIYYALKTHQPIMDDNYDVINRDYDTYAKDLNQHNRIVESPLTEAAEKFLRSGENNIPFRVLNSADKKPVKGSVVKVRFSRPATVNQDSHGECTTDEKGECSIAISLAATGPWEIKLQTHDDTGSFFEVQRIIVSK
jgi:hypothetical protein